VIEMYLNRTV